MTSVDFCWIFHSVVAAFLLSGCAEMAGGEDIRPISTEGMQIVFEDVSEPNVLNLEGTAVIADRSKAGGLWGVVPALRRPERANVVDLKTGRSVTVSLFRATQDLGGHVIMLSSMAANELGISEQPTRVRITALRSQPRLLAP